MKSTGVVRKVDELGRIVLPVELRRNFDVKEKDPLEIFVDGDQIILQKYKPDMTCDITGETSAENKKFANGNLVLSPEGARLLMNELQTALMNR